MDVASGVLIGPFLNKLRVVSVIAAYSWTGNQPEDDSMEFGIAHGDYTAAEIEECLESQGSVDFGDKIEQERANRLVRSIGIITGGEAAAAGGAFNDGKPVKTRLNWLLTEGESTVMWVRNGSGVIYTTGSNLVVSGDMWVKD